MDDTHHGNNLGGRGDDDVAMMAATGALAFAQETGEESCGASNPKIDSPAGPPSEKGNKGKEFEDCGFRNNPHGGPVGQEE